MDTNSNELFEGVQDDGEGSNSVEQNIGSEKSPQNNQRTQRPDTISELQKKAEQIANDSEPAERWNKKRTDNKSTEQDGKTEQRKTLTKDNLAKKPLDKKSDDLMDENGNILAKAGAERRVYEESQKIKKDWNTFQTEVLPKIKQQYDDAMNRANKLEQLDGVIKANGLTHDEINIIAQVAVTFKKNPVEALKMMLTNAVNQGYDVSEILNAGQTQSIESILNKKLEPLQKLFEERKNSDEEKARQDAVIQAVQEFQETFPHSKTHSKEIVEVTKRLGLEPNIGNYTKAYWKLRSFYEQKGYDFSKVFSESAKDTESNIQQNDFEDGIGRIPPVTRNSSVNKSNIVGDVGVNTSYRDIIKGVFDNLNRKG